MSNGDSLRKFLSLRYKKLIGNTLDTEHQFNDDLFRKPPKTKGKLKKGRTKRTIEMLLFFLFFK